MSFQFSKWWIGIQTQVQWHIALYEECLAAGGTERTLSRSDTQCLGCWSFMGSLLLLVCKLAKHGWTCLGYVYKSSFHYRQKCSVTVAWLVPTPSSPQLQCNQRVHEGRSSDWTERHRAPGVCSWSRLVLRVSCTLTRSAHRHQQQLDNTGLRWSWLVQISTSPCGVTFSCVVLSVRVVFEWRLNESMLLLKYEASLLSSCYNCSRYRILFLHSSSITIFQLNHIILSTGFWFWVIAT